MIPKLKASKRNQRHGYIWFFLAAMVKHGIALTVSRLVQSRSSNSLVQ